MHKDGVGVRVEFWLDVVGHSSKVEGSIDKRNILWRRATRNRHWVNAYSINMLFLDMLNQGMQVSKLQIAAAEVRALWPALSDRNINSCQYALEHVPATKYGPGLILCEHMSSS